jgi:Protein of unknown function (DUF4256)/YCII-related domain
MPSTRPSRDATDRNRKLRSQGQVWSRRRQRMVSVRNGKRQVHDGPYAATKKFLGGFVIDVPNLDAALEWALEVKVMNNIKSKKKALSLEQHEELLRALKARFEKNMNRHKGLEWAKVQAKLEASTEKLWSLNEMERTGGEPDVVGHDKKTGEYIFYDCSAESPKGRRSLCYDREALESRKEHKPENNAIDMAAAMGIELLTEEQYRELQKLGDFDTKTSSWVKTPSDIRNLGGALFCDRRYDNVFVYHNGAESYYAARAFRGSLRI